jgi:hypothetical protein
MIVLNKHALTPSSTVCFVAGFELFLQICYNGLLLNMQQRQRKAFDEMKIYI